MRTFSPGHGTIRAMLIALLMLLVSTGISMAADWVAASVSGSVLLLVGDRWQELRTGQALTVPATLRTLGSGQLTVQGDGLALALGGASALRLEKASTPRISHIAGVMAFAVAPRRRLEIETPSGSLSAASGRGRITITGGRTLLELDEGTVAAQRADGRTIALSAGQSLDLSSTSEDPVDTPGQGGGKPSSEKGGENGGEKSAGKAADHASENAGGNKAASENKGSGERGKGSGQGGTKSDKGKKGD